MFLAEYAAAGFQYVFLKRPRRSIVAEVGESICQIALCAQGSGMSLAENTAAGFQYVFPELLGRRVIAPFVLAAGKSPFQINLNLAVRGAQQRCSVQEHL